MALFRCEEMGLYQLFLQSEAAYNCVGEMGEIGLVQFRDMNPEVNAFQRKFVNEVRRCDEMERKLRFIEKEVKKEDHMKIAYSVADPKQVPQAREINELENQLEKLENELRELLSNQEQLQKNFLELTELKQVLLRTSTFFQEADSQRFAVAGASVGLSGGDEGEVLLEGEAGAAASDQGAMQLGVVAGVINRDRLGAFERVLWRVCRGNVFVKHADIEEPLTDPASGESLLKCVFIVFFQGEQLGNRVKKICEGFRATLYPCPEQTAERQEMLNGVEARITDLRVVLDQTLSHRAKVLESAAANLPLWFVKVRKIKSIYHTLNLFQVSHKYLQVQCWIPLADIPKIQAALDRGTLVGGSSVPSVMSQIPTKESPPTFNRTNKFTNGFQNIIDAYGVATYREINPMPFTVITFPFLFAVMFGDCGHGIIMALFAGLLIWKEKQIIRAKSKNEIFCMFFGGRYVIFLMGVFSIYTGILYNDMFSKSLNIFGSQWELIDNPFHMHKDETVQLDPKDALGDRSPYPFGIDPIWQVAENKLDFLNSFKMKLSVILGVIHMMFGVWLSLLNHTYFKKPLNVIAEFVPQFIFLTGLFGYLVFMVIYKWFAFSADNSKDAPALLDTFTKMFMLSAPVQNLYTGQETVQQILLVVAVLCVPWMLLLKPIVLYINHRNPKTNSNLSNGLSFKNLSNLATREDAEGTEGLISNDELANETDGDEPTVISSETSNTHVASTSSYGAVSSGGHDHDSDEEARSRGAYASVPQNDDGNPEVGFKSKLRRNHPQSSRTNRLPAKGGYSQISTESSDEETLENSEETDALIPVSSVNDDVARTDHTSDDEMFANRGEQKSESEEEFEFGQIMILQCIHTIEFCLGCISHTASYLRLWALSLAHAELSEVLWSMVMSIGLGFDNIAGAFVIPLIFGAWAVLTVAILLLMEGLSAFLHALRLHWVEFQSKFYHGDGHLFVPFSFEHIIENPLEE